MLAIQQNKTQKGKCVPNILPCRVNHNSSVNISKRYWAPEDTKEGKTISHFRGRELHGRKVKIPEGYKGVVLAITDKIGSKEDQAPAVKDDEDDEDEELEEPIGTMEERAEFEELIVWGHEAVPEESADCYVKGIQEWIGLAEQLHSTNYVARTFGA